MAFSILNAEAKYTDAGIGYVYRVLVDSSEDLTDLPDDALPGSEAFTAAGTYKAMMDNDGSWVEQTAEAVVEEG